MKKSKSTKQILGLMLGYSLALIIAGLVLGNFSETVAGLGKIITSPAQLTIDYFKIGTPAGTFLNSGLVGLACVLVFLVSGFELNGLSLMSFFLTIGFSFFGINVMNIWPCFLGVWLFSRVAKVTFASVVNIALFATCLSPFVSEMVCRYPVFEGVLAAQIAAGIVIGVIAGFLMGVLCQYSPNLHKGYTLYSAAAVAGFIAILIYSTMYKAVGIEAPTNTDIGDPQVMIVNIFAIVVCVLTIIAGFFINGKSFKGYLSVLKSTGYKCDFTKSAGVGLTFINIGVFGLFATAYYNITGGNLTGVTMGCIICLLAVSPCGAHILNMLPIMIGYAIASTFCAFELTTQAIIVGLCFAGALVPISGSFGSIAGIIAGIMHACMVTSVVTFHGGFCLYNGGFTSGITAILLVAVLTYFFNPSEKLSLLPKRKTADE